MWICSRYGFYSAVQNREDPTEVVVRARLRDHLEELTAFGIRDNEIVFTPEGDYHYRVTLSRKRWEKIVLILVRDIDYPNFKNAVKDYQGETDFEKALHKVWGILYGIQKKLPWGKRAIKGK